MRSVPIFQPSTSGPIDGRNLRLRPLAYSLLAAAALSSTPLSDAPALMKESRS